MKHTDTGCSIRVGAAGGGCWGEGEGGGEDPRGGVTNEKQQARRVVAG